jgi:hypothetical protein
MERRMAALFLLALVLIAGQALRTEPVRFPSYQMVTKADERLLPVAVPSWLPPPELPADLPQRLAFLDDRALPWTVGEGGGAPGAAECRVFVRFSSQHWMERQVSTAGLARWRQAGNGAQRPWQRLYFSAGSFLDDDDGDGDPVDDGELRAAGPGAEAEVFCGVSPPPREPAP